MVRILVQLLFLFCSHSLAHAFDSSLVIPRSAVRHTSFTSYDLADSFSKVGDSIQASAQLMRIDPYHLMYQGYSPENLDTFFSEYKVTVRAKEEYRKKFGSVYNTPRTEVYKIFRAMLDEDQRARYKFDKCSDSFSCAVYAQQMRHTDSVHFDYLYKYIQKHGWPKLSDGSLYVELLAMHDGDRFIYNLGHMKKAVLAGEASFNGYCNLLNRAMKPTFAELAGQYKNKVAFDVSYILKEDTPSVAQLNLMKKAAKNHMPILYYYFVYEGNNRTDFDKFISGERGYSMGLTGWGVRDIGYRGI